MDVRCERCKTEYEFEDSRITEAGVTVRCTTCEHVFMVKKKALVVTVPVKPGGTDAGVPLTQHSTPGGSGAPQGGREWRVRTSDGNVFQFRELTTLQKWIVERKVMRDDEISLNGESWKRLGSIAELASFFQVVDEAQSAQSMRSKADVGSVVLAPDASPPPPSAPFESVAPAPRPAPARAPQRTSAALTPAERAAANPSEGGGKGWLWALLAVLVVAAAAAAWAYTKGLLPGAPRPTASADAGIAPPVAVAPASPVAAEVDAGVVVAAVDAGSPAPPTAEVAPVLPGPVAVTGAPDAGTSSDASPASFETLLKQADRFRVRERAMAALHTYARAMQADPTRAEPHAGRALVLLDQGDSLKAEAAFQQALKLDPRYGVALIGLAETYRIQGRNSEAIQYYERYLEVLPSGPEATVARSAIQRLKQ